MDIICMEGLDSVEGAIKERPNFGKTQIRNIEDIKKGKVYIRYISGHGERIFSLSNPFKKDKGWWFRGCCEGKKEGIISLGDCGVVPYYTGMWHPAAWIEEEKKKKKKEKLIKRINCHLRHPRAGRGL